MVHATLLLCFDHDVYDSQSCFFLAGISRSYLSIIKGQFIVHRITDRVCSAFLIALRPFLNSRSQPTLRIGRRGVCCSFLHRYQPTLLPTKFTKPIAASSAKTLSSVLAQRVALGSPIALYPKRELIVPSHGILQLWNSVAMDTLQNISSPVSCSERRSTFRMSREKQRRVGSCIVLNLVLDNSGVLSHA